MAKKPSHNSDGMSRRKFFKEMGGGVVGTAVLETAPIIQRTLQAAEQAGTEIIGPEPKLITLTVNGQKRSAYIDPRWSLLDVIRDVFHLTGTKKVCNQGQCGGCTVLLNGETAYSCITLAVDVNDAEIVTVEGLVKGEELHPIQKAFIQEDAMQCGYCIPGHIMSVKALLDKNPKPTVEDVKTALSGNLCKCGAQYNILKAAVTASKMIAQ